MKRSFIIPTLLILLLPVQIINADVQSQNSVLHQHSIEIELQKEFLSDDPTEVLEETFMTETNDDLLIDDGALNIDSEEETEEEK